MTEQEVKPCRFANGSCIHCEATERDGCLGWVCSPKRPWVGLTDEEMQACWNDTMATPEYSREGIYRAIEAKLKAKNDY